MWGRGRGLFQSNAAVRPAQASRRRPAESRRRPAGPSKPHTARRKPQTAGRPKQAAHGRPSGRPSGKATPRSLAGGGATRSQQRPGAGEKRPRSSARSDKLCASTPRSVAWRVLAATLVYPCFYATLGGGVQERHAPPVPGRETGGGRPRVHTKVRYASRAFEDTRKPLRNMKSRSHEPGEEPGGEVGQARMPRQQPPHPPPPAPPLRTAPTTTTPPRGAVRVGPIPGRVCSGQSESVRVGPSRSESIRQIDKHAARRREAETA